MTAAKHRKLRIKPFMFNPAGNRFRFTARLGRTQGAAGRRAGGIAPDAHGLVQRGAKAGAAIFPGRRLIRDAPVRFWSGTPALTYTRQKSAQNGSRDL